MSKRVIVNEAEYLEPADYNRLGTYPQDATDAIVGGAVGYPAHWSSYTISQKSAQEITVSPGRYYEGETVYQADLAADINLTLYLPLAASDERWVAIIARGRTDTIREDRAFETSKDPETSQPVDISTPVISARVAEYTVQQGVASPAPANKPVIAATDACLAFVRLTTSGVQEIVPGEQWRVKTLFEVEGRVTAVEFRVAQVAEETVSLRTNLANVAAGLKNVPDPRLFAQIVRDTSRHAQKLNLPEEARNYFFDQALVRDFWDFTAGGFFRISEGIRFAYTAQRDHVLRLLNYDDPALSIWDGRIVMPAYTETTRISNPSGTGSKDIASTVHTVVTAVQHTVAHERIRYGETVTVCENTAGWGDVGAARAGEIFKAHGEEWVSAGQTANPWNQTATAQNGHAEFAAHRVIRETYYDTYTTYNTETFGLAGAIYGQTFLCAQVMVATSIDVDVTRVGASDITLCLCGVTSAGSPDFSGVLARTTKLRNTITSGRNRFAIPPTLLDQGRRYAWFVVTDGNYALATSSGNAFSGGTLFTSSDGAWAQGSTTEDFVFWLQGAKFKSSRVVIPMESIELVGGMTEIEMVYKSWAPAATALVWEVKAQGDSAWIPMDTREDNPLANLPPLVQLRAVMIGTQDVAPAIILDPYARVIAGRMRTDMQAISKLKTFGFATNAAQIVLQMDNFDAALHTATPKIVLEDKTVITATSNLVTVDPVKPSRTKIVANFALPAGTTKARARVDATSKSVIDMPFGQDIQLNAF